MQKPASSPARLEGSRQGLARRGARGSRLGALGTQLRGAGPAGAGGPVRDSRGHREGRVRESPAPAATDGHKLSRWKWHRFIVSRLVDGRLGGAGRKVPAQLAPRGPWGDPLWLPPASSGRLRSLAHTMPRGLHLRVTCALTDTPASLLLPVWSLWTGRDHLPGSRSLITSTKSPCYVG